MKECTAYDSPLVSISSTALEIMNPEKLMTLVSLILFPLSSSKWIFRGNTCKISRSASFGKTISDTCIQFFSS